MSRIDARADVDTIRLTVGVAIISEQDVNDDVAAARRSGSYRNHVYPSTAVTIASWWAEQYPTFRALIDHTPVSRRAIAATIADILADPAWSQSGADTNAYLALEALKTFVEKWNHR